MYLYRTDPNSDFISVVAEFIITKFADDLDKLKVILPTGYTCLELKRNLVQRQGIMILPHIQEFSKISIESTGIFKVPTETIESISYLENKIILAEIISSYQRLNFNLAQSLKLSPLLADLFHKFSINNLNIEDLDKIHTHASAEHWQFIYRFITYAKTELLKRIANLRKADSVSWFKNLLSLEIERLKDSKKKLLIAGVTGSDQTSWQFLHEAAISGAYLILPPFPEVKEKTIKNTLKPEEDGLYCLKQLLKFLNCKFDEFKNLGSEINCSHVYDELITNDNQEKLSLPQNLEYKEFENIFDEARYIAQICRKIIKENSIAKIAIVINNKSNKEFYCNYLSNYSITICDLLGEEASGNNIYQLIFNISEIICHDFALDKLLQILKNPFVLSEEVLNLEKFLRKTKNSVSSWQQLIVIIRNMEDKNSIFWLENLKNSIDIEVGNKFNKILEYVLLIAEQIVPDLWQYEQAGKIAQMFREIVKLNWTKNLDDKADFPNILKELIAGAYSTKNNSCPASVTIGTHQELALLKFDHIVLADFNEGNWPKSFTKSPWLNRQMQEQLDFYDQQITVSTSLYNFYLLLFNNKILITRAKKQNNSAQAAESSYLLKLKFITNNFGDKYIGNESDENSENLIADNLQVITSNDIDNNIKLAENILFPEKISVTDIEMLVRGPYSFYAKKILNLRVLDNITSTLTLADFGNFVHGVIDKYSKTYSERKDKLEALLDICDNYLNESFINKNITNNWRIKFRQVADEFIDFDQKRREKNLIYSEVPGEMTLDVAGRQIKIIAIADRIEIDSMKRATIVDFKTGSIPTKKDIICGLSPQLIIEAMIMTEGGFDLKTQEVPKIEYVKIASSKPYLKIINIELDQEDLESHRQGIAKLLEHYIINKNFIKDLDLLKYNNYKHLSRSL